MTRTLIVMRHAKAVPFAGSDFERVLELRGHRDAADAGRFLAKAQVVPDYVVVSPAARTTETWQDVAAAGGFEVEAVFDRALYDGGTDAVLEALQAAPDHAQVVMYVGHNPTAQLLVTGLDDQTGDAELSATVLREFPTSAVTILTVAGDWSTLASAGARVDQVYVGRGAQG